MWPLTNLTPVYVYVCWLFSVRGIRKLNLFTLLSILIVTCCSYSLPEFVFFFLSNCCLCNGNSNSKVCFIYLLGRSIILMMHFIVTNSYQRKLFDSLNEIFERLKMRNLSIFNLIYWAFVSQRHCRYFVCHRCQLARVSKQANERSATRNSNQISNISAYACNEDVVYVFVL